MTDTPLLDAPWPDGLDPATVPFKTRSVTILRRAGLFDDPSRFNTLTEDQVLSWVNAGLFTVADIRATGNEAIRHHHAETALLDQINTDLDAIAREPWARHVWRHDPRFAEFLPKGDATVYDIATSGSAADRRFLWDRRHALRAAVDAQAALTLPDAVAEYVEAISGQRGERLDVLLAYTGLGGQDQVGATDSARRLGVTRGRIYQIRDQLLRRRDRARPPAGIWMPQIVEAERDGWPDRYTQTGIDATTEFFDPVGS